MSQVSSLLRAIRVPFTRERVDVASIYEAHCDFLFASLTRLGVRDADRPDALQDVLVVVHRRLGSWDHASKLTSWLFGICIKVAAKHRRRAHVRREAPIELSPSSASIEHETPEDLLLQRDARARLERVLDGMDLEKRAVFVMYELEELSTREIADQLGVVVGTIHSRLHAARKDFEASLTRVEAREGHDTCAARAAGTAGAAGPSRGGVR